MKIIHDQISKKPTHEIIELLKATAHVPAYIKLAAAEIKVCSPEVGIKAWVCAQHALYGFQPEPCYIPRHNDNIPMNVFPTKEDAEKFCILLNALHKWCDGYVLNPHIDLKDVK